MANSSLTAGEGREHGGGSVGAVTVSVIELTALGTRGKINKQYDFPVLLLQISFLSSFICNICQGSTIYYIPQHNAGERAEESEEVIKCWQFT